MKIKQTEEQKLKKAMSKLGSFGGKSTFAKYGREYFVDLAKKSNAKQKKNKKKKLADQQELSTG